MEDLFAFLSDTEARVFKAIAVHANSLGYRPKRDKTAAPSYSFVHPKIRRHILRFTLNRGKPILKLKYYAAPEYSTFFHEAIRTTIEEYDYRYTGCYGCGKCDETEGYRYRYQDGREYFRCGTELIELTDIASLPLTETLNLLEKQHYFFLSKQ